MVVVSLLDPLGIDIIGYKLVFYDYVCPFFYILSFLADDLNTMVHTMWKMAGYSLEDGIPLRSQ